MLFDSMRRNGLTLATFAIVATAMLSLTNLLTEDRIAAQQQRYLISQLHEILPDKEFDNALLRSCFEVDNAPLLGSADSRRAWIARNQGDPVAALLEITAPDGYNGSIDLLVGIRQDGHLAGVRTIRHQETPGLGDGIELKHSDWILGFTGKTLTADNEASWAVSKDGGQFDAFTGATITPRAVVKAVRNSLVYFDRHRDALFTRQPGHCGGNADG